MYLSFDEPVDQLRYIARHISLHLKFEGAFRKIISEKEVFQEEQDMVANK